MPRPSKGIRLHLRYKGTASARWEIRDGERRIATGISVADRRAAEAALAEYITATHQPARQQRGIAEISVADVIAIYLEDKVATIPDEGQRKRAAGRAERLLGFFGSKTLAQITGKLCRSYASHRGNAGGARRDLQDLAAAIGHHRREGYSREVVEVDLPPPGKPRERWLTRSELAKLVWAAWSYRAPMSVPGQYLTAPMPPIEKRPARHVARMILMAYYTGSRPGDILKASYHAGAGRSYIDLDDGVFYRKPEDKTETRKRQPPCHLGDRILSHLRRWKRTGQVASYVVEYRGRPVASIKSAFTAAVARSGLEGDIVPYTFRHSRATHLLGAGVSMKDTADALGTSEAMIFRHYGHLMKERAKKVANVR